jgi:hypothetical protein
MAIKMVFYAVFTMRELAAELKRGFHETRGGCKADSFPDERVSKYRVTLEKIKDDEKA